MQYSVNMNNITALLEVVTVVEVFCVTENLWNETLCTLGDARTYKIWCRYEVQLYVMLQSNTITYTSNTNSSSNTNRTLGPWSPGNRTRVPESMDMSLGTTINNIMLQSLSPYCRMHTVPGYLRNSDLSSK